MMRFPAHAAAQFAHKGRTAVRLSYKDEYLPLAELAITLGDLTVTADLAYTNAYALRDELSALLERMEAAGESLEKGNALVTEYPVAS